MRVKKIINLAIAAFVLSTYPSLCTVSWAPSSLRAAANVSWLTVRRSPKSSTPERTTRRRKYDTCRRPSRRWRLPAGTYGRRENSRLFTLVYCYGVRLQQLFRRLEFPVGCESTQYGAPHHGVVDLSMLFFFSSAKTINCQIQTV